MAGTGAIAALRFLGYARNDIGENRVGQGSRIINEVIESRVDLGIAAEEVGLKAGAGWREDYLLKILLS